MPLTASGDRLDQFLAAHADHLRRGGSIVSSYRSRSGRSFGPYYRLTCRDDQGRQRAVYLAGEEAVGRARTALAALQAPRQQTRIVARAQQALRRGHRAAQAVLGEQLKAVGLYRKGSETRGWTRCKSGANLKIGLQAAAPGTPRDVQILENRQSVDQLKG
jgi:hypothetical protein